MRNFCATLDYRLVFNFSSNWLAIRAMNKYIICYFVMTLS